MKQLRDPIVYPSLVDVVGALNQTENRFDVRNDDEELRDDFGRASEPRGRRLDVGNRDRVRANAIGTSPSSRSFASSLGTCTDRSIRVASTISDFFGFDSLLFPLPGTAGIGLCVRVSALEKVRRAAASFFPSVSRDAALQFHQPPGTISNFDKSRLKTPSAAQNLKKRRRTAKMSEENLKSRVRCGQTPVSLTKV